MTLTTFFFFNDTATTEIYTLSLHDALPISFKADRAGLVRALRTARPALSARVATALVAPLADRKSTRLNSSHLVISYAVFCLKKKIFLHLEVTPHLPLTAVIYYSCSLIYRL